MAPDTMVAAVAQNTKLNTNEDQSKEVKSVKIPRVGMPTNPPKASSPSINPAPRRTNTTVPIQKSIRFFIIIFPAFFALVKPVSTIANPACIKKTKAAPIKNQIANACSFTTFNISCTLI